MKVFERIITKRKKDPLKNFGIFKNLPKGIMDDFENAIIEDRKEDINGNLKKTF